MVHPNVKKSMGSEKAFQVMGNLIWNLNNEAVVLSRLLEEEHPLNRSIHTCKGRYTYLTGRYGRVMYFRKAQSATAWQWSRMEHLSSGDPQKV